MCASELRPAASELSTMRSACVVCMGLCTWACFGSELPRNNPCGSGTTGATACTSLSEGSACTSPYHCEYRVCRNGACDNPCPSADMVPVGGAFCIECMLDQAQHRRTLPGGLRRQLHGGGHRHRPLPAGTNTPAPMWRRPPMPARWSRIEASAERPLSSTWKPTTV